MFGYKFRVLLFLFVVFLVFLNSYVLSSDDVVLDDFCSFDKGVVVLTASSGAFGFGHTALLFFVNDSWFYFSWQSSKVVFVEVPVSVLVDFDSFNGWINKDGSIQNYHADYDSAVFIRGDFRGGFLRAQELYFYFLENNVVLGDSFVVFDDLDFDISGFDKNLGYDVFFNNCVHVTYELLSDGFVNCEYSFSSLVDMPFFVSNFARVDFEKLGVEFFFLS